MINNRTIDTMSTGDALSRRVRRPLLAITVLAAAMSMPLAFAQVDPTATPEPAPPGLGDPTMEAATQAETPPTTEPPPPSEMQDDAATVGPEVADPQATQDGGQQGWEQVDTDRDGNISREEAAANAGLAQVFEQADANADGMLTPDEYRQFIEQNYSEPQTP